MNHVSEKAARSIVGEERYCGVLTVAIRAQMCNIRFPSTTTGTVQRKRNKLGVPERRRAIVWWPGPSWNTLGNAMYGKHMVKTSMTLLDKRRLSGDVQVKPTGPPALHPESTAFLLVHTRTQFPTRLTHSFWSHRCFLIENRGFMIVFVPVRRSSAPTFPINFRTKP